MSNALIEHIDNVINVGSNFAHTRGADALIHKSWTRCIKQHGLDPSKPKAAHILPFERVREHQQRMEGFIRVARAGMEDMYRRVADLDFAHFAADPVQPRSDPVLHAARGEQLHSHADAKKRRAAHVNPLRHRFDQTGNRAQPLGAGAETAHAGQNNPVCRAHHQWVGGNDDTFATRRFKRVGDRMKIARAVIDECNDFSHRAGLSSKELPRLCAGPTLLLAASRGRSL